MEHGRGRIREAGLREKAAPGCRTPNRISQVQYTSDINSVSRKKTAFRSKVAAQRLGSRDVRRRSRTREKLASVDGGWEEDVPERRRRSGEFKGHERTLAGRLRGTDDLGGYLNLGLGVLNDHFGAFWQGFGKNHHRAAGTDGVGVALEGLLAGDVNENGNTQQDALRATALFRGGRAGQRRTFGVCWFGVGERWFHSSNPQKSVSGATSSTPYSQPPSGRWLPFQTMMAELLVSVATLVSARRCSSLRS